jgi:glycosyltransferase involved in cell wall biosynthesis
MKTADSPLVSIVVPCYNYGHLLAETLGSISNQTLIHWECIVVDDGSVDNTAEIAKSFTQKDTRFKYIYQKNSGLSAARNTGIINASGKYIQLLDADDLIEKNKLKSQVEYLESHNEIDIIYSEVRYFDSDAPEIFYTTLSRGIECWMHPIKSHQDFLLQLVNNNLLAVNCALYRKEIHTKTGYFNANLKSVEDWEFWFRCALNNYQFYFQQNTMDVFALVRIHPGSMSTNNVRMLEASLNARFGLIEKIKTYDGLIRPKLIHHNNENVKYLCRQLFSYKSNKRRISELVYLFKGYPFKTEWKFILKNTIYWIIGRRN